MNIGQIDNIKDSAPTLAENYIDEEISKNIYKEYSEKIEYYKTIVGIGRKYFFYHLHDSKILSLKTESGNLHLILDDIATIEFACALIDKYKMKINKMKINFPLEIRTEETEHLSLNVVDINGKIYKNKFVKLNEYLYEEIIEWNEKYIEIAFDLWSSKGKRYLLLLCCKRIKIIEKQKEYWDKYFGDKYNNYYNRFLEELDKGEYLSDYSLCEKLIEKIEMKNI
jgi:hypothetical protein